MTEDDTKQLPLTCFADAPAPHEVPGFSQAVVAYGRETVNEAASELLDDRLDNEFALDDLADDLAALECRLTAEGEPAMQVDAWEKTPAQDQHKLLPVRLKNLREAVESDDTDRGYW